MTASTRKAASAVKTYSFAGDAKVASFLGQSLQASGYTPVNVSEADVVFAYCVSESALEDLYYDSKGLLQSTKKGVILVDLSPSTVSFAQELCAMGSVSEKHVLDAPLVVQNIVHEQAFSDLSNLSVVAGGTEEVFKQVEPMLRSFAGKALWMGKAGCGQATKAALTLSSAAALVGLVEAYSSLKSSELQEAQVDRDDFMDVALSLRMLTPAQEAFVEAMEADEFEGSAYTIEHLMGDLAAALACVDDGDTILPQAEAGFRLMELLAMVGGVTFSPAALKLVFADEETSKKYGLDWARAEGAYDHDHECDCDDPDHECTCDDDCDCGHYHQHQHGAQSGSGYISFSSN